MNFQLSFKIKKEKSDMKKLMILAMAAPAAVKLDAGDNKFLKVIGVGQFE